MATQLDAKDKALLVELQKDARQPIAKLAKKVKLHPRTCKYRLDKLRKHGYISSYTIIINEDKTVYKGNYGYLLIKHKDNTKATQDETEGYIRNLEHLIFCDRIGGDYDYLLVLGFTTQKEWNAMYNAVCAWPTFVNSLNLNYLGTVKPYGFEVDHIES